MDVSGQVAASEGSTEAVEQLNRRVKAMATKLQELVTDVQKIAYQEANNAQQGELFSWGFSLLGSFPVKNMNA